MSVEIEQLERDKALEFFSACSFKRSVTKSQKLYYFGLFRSGRLTAVMSFGSPTASHDKALYAFQPHDLALLADKDKSIAASLLIVGFLDSFSPVNFVVPENFSLEAECLETRFRSLRRESGEKYWDWHNPNYTFYVYRISSPESDKYYIGVHGLRQKSASVEDCLEDGYMGGGGGKKFLNWREKYRDSLQKEILEFNSTLGENYQREKELIGDKWRTDPLCLNSTSGGRGAKRIHPSLYYQDSCEKHGKVAFRGSKCEKCTAEVWQELGICERHGRTKLRRGVCYKCQNEKAIQTKECEKHGVTKHMGKTCRKCQTEKAISFQECEKHGLTKFNGSSCYKCQNRVVFVDCNKHGRKRAKKGMCGPCYREKYPHLSR